MFMHVLAVTRRSVGVYVRVRTCVHYTCIYLCTDTGVCDVSVSSQTVPCDKTGVKRRSLSDD